MTSQFRKDIKLAQKRGLKIGKLEKIVEKLIAGEDLSPRHSDHSLTGNYLGFRECHIESDWLLIYMRNDDTLILTAARTGTHSDLF